MAIKTISTIKLKGEEFQIVVPELEKRCDDLQSQISNLEMNSNIFQDKVEKLGVSIYYEGHYQYLEDLFDSLKNQTNELYSMMANNIAEIESLKQQLYANANERPENPNKKYDLEIFGAIEANNPFLQNLI